MMAKMWKSTPHAWRIMVAAWQKSERIHHEVCDKGFEEGACGCHTMMQRRQPSCSEGCTAQVGPGSFQACYTSPTCAVLLD